MSLAMQISQCDADRPSDTSMIIGKSAGRSQSASKSRAGRCIRLARRPSRHRHRAPHLKKAQRQVTSARGTIATASRLTDPASRVETGVKLGHRRDEKRLKSAGCDSFSRSAAPKADRSSGKTRTPTAIRSGVAGFPSGSIASGKHQRPGATSAASGRRRPHPGCSGRSDPSERRTTAWRLTHEADQSAGAGHSRHPGVERGRDKRRQAHRTTGRPRRTDATAVTRPGPAQSSALHRRKSSQRMMSHTH